MIVQVAFIRNITIQFRSSSPLKAQIVDDKSHGKYGRHFENRGALELRQIFLDIHSE